VPADLSMSQNLMSGNYSKGIMNVWA
jgi:hypothetical protein